MSREHRVLWCFHTTAMVADYEFTRDALTRLVGLRVLEDSRIEDPAIGRRGGMAWIGPTDAGGGVIEIGEPIVEGGAVDRFVSRFGSHMSSVAVQVADIDATVAFLDEHGVRIASRIDGHIVFTHPGDTAGIVIEWFGSEDPHDPRYGGPVPEASNQPVLDVTGMAFAGAVVGDPAGAAARLAELFGHDATFVDPSAPVGSPAAAVSMGDIPLVFYRLPEPDESETLWGTRYTRAQTCNLGVQVADLTAARLALTAAEVPVLRDEPDAVVIAPQVTGGVALVLVELPPHGG